MRSFFVLLTLVIGLLPSRAQAWGGVGHRTIAAITWDRLSPQAKRDLRGLAIRRRGAFVAEAVWADEVRSRDEYAWSRPLHYLNVARGDAEVGRPEACDAEDRGCVLSAIERFEGVLSNPEATADARREAVAFLIHFVGDIHQPLHCGYGDDRGGNDLHLNFRGSPTNLHRLWDDQ
ncbi:MAG: S1/P1 nuclease, partial [Nannocystaceae bacterium]